MEAETRLPLAVRKRVQRAKELEKQLREGVRDAKNGNGANAADQPSVAAQQPQEAPNEQANPVQESADTQGGESQEKGAGSEQSQQHQAQAQVNQQAKPADPRENDPAYWKQRFNSTMGILRREREERLLESRRAAEKIAALEAELAKAKEAAASSSLDLSEYLTAEQIEELGEQKAAEMVALARKVAESEVKRRVEAALAPIAERQKHEQAARQRELVARFHDDLTSAVPNWQEINRDEDWLAFLGEEDQTTGLIRQDIIDMAQERYDAKPVIAMLKQFLAARGLSPPAGNKQPPTLPSSSAAAGRSDASVVFQEPEEPITPAELKRRYSEIATNRRLSEAERMKRLAELDQVYKRLLGRR